eukprot:2998093-Prymnesium_polylepis.1
MRSCSRTLATCAPRSSRAKWASRRPRESMDDERQYYSRTAADDESNRCTRMCVDCTMSSVVCSCVRIRKRLLYHQKRPNGAALRAASEATPRSNAPDTCAR